MPALNIFDDDAFSVRSLTKAINDAPYQPMLIDSMGLFAEDGITTTALFIERRGSTITMVPAAARGTPGQNSPNDKSRLIPINTVHLPQRGAVVADEVQNVRAFGSESDVEMVQNIVNRKLAKLRRNLDVTIEYQRIGAIKGKVLDADGSTVLLDVNATFDLAQQSQGMLLTTDSTKVKSLITAAARKVESALGGIMHRGLVAFCGTNFFDTMVGHPAVEKAYDRYLESLFLRSSQRSQDPTSQMGQGFEFVDVQWREYRGSVNGVPFIDPDEAYLVPMGVADMFITNYAPADYMETVNTMGLPYYAKQELMKMGKGIEIETQSNPISLNTRPDAVIKLTTV